VPVVCGLGHEDDTTIADLVADYRAATPTAALVALLPDRAAALQALNQRRMHLVEVVSLRLQAGRQHLARQREKLLSLHPSHLLQQRRQWLSQHDRLLRALSPHHLLERGFSLLRDGNNRLVRSIGALKPGDAITVQLVDGLIRAKVQSLEVDPAPCEPLPGAPP
jgi:exodeoxyribonuclease VII large subunit